MFLEIYSIVRLLSIMAPPSFPLRRRIDALKDFRIVRGISLLVFDLVIFVPSVVQTSLLGDTLPFSIAALIVIGMSLSLGLKNLLTLTKLHCLHLLSHL